MSVLLRARHRESLLGVCLQEQWEKKPGGITHPAGKNPGVQGGLRHAGVGVVERPNRDQLTERGATARVAVDRRGRCG